MKAMHTSDTMESATKAQIANKRRLKNIWPTLFSIVVLFGLFGYVYLNADQFRDLLDVSIASLLLLCGLVLISISVTCMHCLRGLDRLGDLLFVGISPASILCINRQSGALVDSYCYSDDVATCIHGLRVLAE